MHVSRAECNTRSLAGEQADACVGVVLIKHRRDRTRHFVLTLEIIVGQLASYSTLTRDLLSAAQAAPHVHLHVRP